ncbi:MAG: suppressor of glycerol defect [Cirrosporium novae-zelandiae]|nr:MAG: suppressor of glycerol defect [Cirrosporium novae-zelandiae]
MPRLNDPRGSNSHTVTLPKQLLEQLEGLEGNHISPKRNQPSGRNKRNYNGSLGRKDRRKAERAVKKGKARQGRTIQEHESDDDVDENLDDVLENGDKDGESEPPPPEPEKPLKSILKPAKQTKPDSTPNDRNPPLMPKKSILKRTQKPDPIPASNSHDVSPPPPPPPRPSKKVKEQLAQDDAEILWLEKQLGMKKGKKLLKAFHDDGLDGLLGGIDELVGVEGSGNGKRKRGEEEQWLAEKRRKALGGDDATEEEAEADSSGKDDDMESSNEDSSNDDEDVEDKVEDEEFGGFSDSDKGAESDPSISEPPEAVKPQRENPYIAPTTSTVPVTKYKPPALQGVSPSDTEALTRLRRQTQGLLNRLSEGNLLSILGDVEKLYRENPRQHVTSTLVNLLLGLICDPSSLYDTFLILHAGFICAIYKVIGTDFGAALVQRVVEELDKRLSFTEGQGKEGTNLISLVAELYTFQVVGSTLMFDYIRELLGDLSEHHAEMLLKIIRNAGTQLRQDDPSALKDVVLMLQPAIAKVGEENLSVRTKFMIETIDNLKNNRMKTGFAAFAVASEHRATMRKTLGSLNSRSIRASEPLRIGLTDIRNSDKRGKWWLVGASWKGNDSQTSTGENAEIFQSKVNTSDSEDGFLEGSTMDLLRLAKEQRMNTDVRRSIFISIMSAQDYQDAHRRLLKLRLKKSQENEIPRVLVHCTGAEEVYNPFYTIIARKLCSERRLQFAFQFALWDLFKRMGESGDLEGDYENVDLDEDDSISMQQTVNLAKMFGSLIAEGALKLSVLKTLNITYLQSKAKMFVELMLITVIVHSQRKCKQHRHDEKALVNIFASVKDAPPIIAGLRYFVRKVVRKTDVAGGKKEREVVKWGWRVAYDTLGVLETEMR